MSEPETFETIDFLLEVLITGKMQRVRVKTLGCLDSFSRVTAENKPEGFFSFHISGIILKGKVN